jgi:hypothetical protein
MARHIIQRQVVELRTRHSLPVQEIESEVEFLLTHEVWPEIEAICSRLEVAGRTIQIGRMELDLAAMPSTGLRSQWSREVCRLFRANLRKRVASFPSPLPPALGRNGTDSLGKGTPGETAGADTARSAQGSRIEALLFFLRHGLLPWWWDRDEPDMRSLMAELLTKARPALRRLLRTSLMETDAAVRLSGQFATETVRAILELLLASRSGAAMVVALHERAMSRFPSPPGPPLKPAALIAIESSLLAVACHLADRADVTESELLAGLMAEVPHSDTMFGEFLANAMSDLTTDEADVLAAKSGPDARTAPQVPDQRQAESTERSEPVSIPPPEVDLTTDEADVPAAKSGPDARSAPQVPDQRQAESTERSEPVSIPPPEADLTTDEAGLVLLWPFLERFFTHLGLLEDGDFPDQTARWRALHLLHFFATGEDGAPEHALALSKVLCAVPLPETVPFSVGLTEPEQTAATELLDAVIENWPPLKNTSICGFRQAFLRREGRLALPEDATPMPGWRLRVERKGHDILLDQLPWGLYVVRLPWMPQPLYVEW